MKFSRLSLLALIPALMLFVSTSASAQAPEGQLGIQAGTHGLGIQYALSPSLHLGSTFNIQLVDGDFIMLRPYAKFLLEGDVNPYFAAGIELGDVNTTIFASFGLEYFANENVGFFGDVDILRLDIDADPSRTVLGLISGHAGIEYFFD